MKSIGSYPNVRLRRNRKTDWSRRLVSESNLSSNDLIWPIFIREGKNLKEPIKSMPGVFRYSLDNIEYLVEKYQTIEDLFDLTETIRVNDFIAISQALEQKSDWEELLKLGKLAQKQYPGTTMGYYFTALSQEGLGEPKKALRTYQSAFPMNELGGISEDFLMMKAEAIKRDFGYN